MPVAQNRRLWSHSDELVNANQQSPQWLSPAEPLNCFAGAPIRDRPHRSQPTQVGKGSSRQSGPCVLNLTIDRATEPPSARQNSAFILSKCSSTRNSIPYSVAPSSRIPPER